MLKFRTMKPKKSAAVISVVALLLAQSAFACDYPSRLKGLPDGNSATRDEMLAGSKAVKSYLAEMDTYLACIQAEEAQAVIALGDLDEKTKRQRESAYDKKHNAAVEDMNRVAEEFNIQVRAFKAKNK